MAATAAAAPVSKTAAAAAVPLILAQFIASFAASNMNVAINDIAFDLHTTVFGVQTAITLFTLVMAALMIPGSKLTDLWGRKSCLLIGLGIYGVGAFVAALAQQIWLLVVGYSILEGVGSALLIPPIYILITILFSDLGSRARYFGLVSAAAGVGAAAGPLIGGVITSAISWRASFLLQVAVVGVIFFLARKIADMPIAQTQAKFDITGTILSAAGLIFIVIGTLLSRTYGWVRAREDFVVAGKTIIHQGGLSPIWICIGIGALFLVWFFVHISSYEQNHKQPLLSTRLFKNRTANLGLITQNIQWLTMQGSFFVISVFLQAIRGFSAIATGLALTPATLGILLTSTTAARLAKRFTQPALIRGGFVCCMVGMVLLLLLARADSNILTFVPGLLLIGIGVGAMLTSSVNVVQSSFPEKDQGEISGLSRSVSNLGSSLGTAIAGSVLVSSLVVNNAHFVLALVVLLGFDLIGLLAAIGLGGGRRVGELKTAPDVSHPGRGHTARAS